MVFQKVAAAKSTHSGSSNTVLQNESCHEKHKKIDVIL